MDVTALCRLGPPWRAIRFLSRGAEERIMTKRIVVGLAVLGALTAFAPAALADNVCGTAPATWNVPAGDIALTQTVGPVMNVLTAVGEYRSHSMLSSPYGYVTHATSVTPKQNGDKSPYWTPFCSSCGSECWNPLDPGFLNASTPGLEQVQAGAIYAFLYNNGTNNFLQYQRAATNPNTGGPNWQSAISNYSWNGGDGLGFNWLGSTGDGSQGYYGVTYNGTQAHYGWFQYMNIQGTASGTPGQNTGVVCSSALALWQHDALSGTAGYTGDVSPRTYPSGTITNGANALWNAVYNECQSQNGWFSSIGSFFTNLGYSGLCVGSGESGVCNAAADQMVNCFATGQCGNTSSPHNYNQGAWHSAVNGSSVAISPDDIGCWNGNGTGAPCSGAGSSVWGWDNNQAVQWNSGGNQYSCWD
jgi:hypothetical protein